MDTEDALQATFLALLRSGKRFESTAHQKAWLIVTASNICRNMLKRSHRRDVPFDPELNSTPDTPDGETLGAVLGLPDPMRLCIYLHYYEGYTGHEIARHDPQQGVDRVELPAQRTRPFCGPR